MVYHARGWMEGGLTTGFEKTIIGSEMIGMMGALRGGIDFSDADEAMEAIAEVGAGHFLGSPHTVARCLTAFHPPIHPNPQQPFRTANTCCCASATRWPSAISMPPCWTPTGWQG